VFRLRTLSLFGLDSGIFSCNLTHRIPLPRIGLLMVSSELNRPTEHSSLARTVTIMLTLSRRHAQNQNAKFLLGFSCRKNYSRPTISPPMGGLISRLVPSATEPLRLVFTCVYIVLSPVRCGDKSWLGKVRLPHYQKIRNALSMES
jgi:hypothetical protein